MLIVMAPAAPEDAVAAVERLAAESGMRVHRSRSDQGVVLHLDGGDGKAASVARFEALPGVAQVVQVRSPYKLASRAYQPEDTVFEVGGTTFGGSHVVLMAGPCAVESEAQVERLAPVVKRAGACVMRGGAWKPRTSPYSFQGLGEEGLRFLSAAARRHGLLVITEVMKRSQIKLAEPYADILQVGARNMQNFDLLRELGACGKPVLLKRGLAATIEEWLLSAEYLMAGGNRRVLLCERGIRTFEPATRNTLDISAIPVVKSLSHLPVVVDPSHAVGIRNQVPPAARAAVAAGADGLLLEVHDDPEHALSDGPQSLLPEQLYALTHELGQIAAVIGRTLAPGR